MHYTIYITGGCVCIPWYVNHIYASVRVKTLENFQQLFHFRKLFTVHKVLHSIKFSKAMDSIIAMRYAWLCAYAAEREGEMHHGMLASWKRYWHTMLVPIHGR